MPNKPKNPPQSYEEMTAIGQERRQNSRIYRAESMELSEAKISDIVSLTAAELAKLADTGETISLFDTQEVKRRSILYLRSCADTSSIPSFNALSRSFGYSREGVNKFRREHPTHESTRWLDMVHDAIADTLADCALHNLSNSVVSIFALKAQSGWRDSITIETPITQAVLGAEVSAEAIAAKYAELPSD